MFIQHFKQLSKKDTGIAGGKGASLGEMTHAGFPVPPGFVVPASAFEKFLEESDIDVEIESILHTVKHQDINSVERASEEIRDLIHDAEFPKDIGREIAEEYKKLKTQLVAVRSSATAEDSSIASWAGELESYLNVTQRNLLESVKKCWSSLFTPRAIFYRFEKYPSPQPSPTRGEGDRGGRNSLTGGRGRRMVKISVAVVVQKMVQSEISGICFTVHPVTKDYDQMVIEAAFGLGEAIVGGKVTPDTYVVKKSTNQKNKKATPRQARGGVGFEILDKNIGEQRMKIIPSPKGTKEVAVPKPKQGKQKISDAKILEIAQLCSTIEKHYNKPQDIEWAYKRGKFYILQSRPITTL